MALETSTAMRSDHTTRRQVPRPRVLESVAPAVAGMGGKTEGTAEGRLVTTTRMRMDTVREHLLARLVAARSGASVSHGYAVFALHKALKQQQTLTSICFTTRHCSRAHRRHHITGNQDRGGTRASYPSEGQGERQSPAAVRITLRHPQNSIHLHLRVGQCQQDG